MYYQYRKHLGGFPSLIQYTQQMRPNARVLVQPGGPPGWRIVTQQDVILYVDEI